ncbi:MAG TPA: MFS transporter [Candidatus Stercoripulliclostridium merdigallinarum]|uniref:MFS transporter n=1 Tax=Candidatus Stercoripulliclostridium merdigallinarum TaxID=2840951 RepID=A0A9D1MHH7_9FIRM|nr:MFS transporter [Candidatus Stercoripulliclostridium merdigallinarum]
MEATGFDIRKDVRPFGIRDKIGYALGDLGCNLSFSLISAFMLDFYTQYIGIPGAIWSVIIIVTKVWDGVNDPIMGGIMDSVRIGRSGSKFKPWMSIAAIGLTVTGALVFLPVPNAALWLKVTLCIVTYLLWDICYTLMNVPYGSLSAAITADPLERTSLSTWRSIGAAIGGGISMLLPLLLYDDNQNLNGDILIWVALAMGAVALAVYILCIKMTTERVVVPPERREKINYLKTLKGFITNRPLLALCLASFASIVFFLSSTQTAKWLFQIHFHNTDMISVATIISYLPMVFFIPFTSKLVAKFGKKYSVGMPFALSIVAAVVMLCIPIPGNQTGMIIYIVGLMLIQSGGGMFNLITWAMVNDCIDYQQLKTGMREEGSVYAMYSLFRKIAQGVSLSLPLLCMQAVGYNPQADPIGNQDPGVPEAMVKMSIGLMLIGAVIMFVSFILIYNLGKKEVADMQAKLNKTDEDEKLISMPQGDD